MKTIGLFGLLTIIVVAVACFFEILKNPVPCIKTIDAFLDMLQSYNAYNRQENIFLSSNFAPVESENILLEVEKISGQFPKSLSGIFLQIGPNPILSHIGGKRYHASDGYGMIHSLRIKDSSAIYSNQWVVTPRFTMDNKFNHTMLVMRGELIGVAGLCKSVFWGPAKAHLLGVKKGYRSLANGALLTYSDNIYALQEGELPFLLKWNENGSFTSVGFESFGEKLNFPLSAHPKVDHANEKLYFSGYSTQKEGNSFMKFGTIKGGSLATNFQVDSLVPSFGHDIMITENYAILIENPVYFSGQGILKGEPFSLKPGSTLRFCVIPKNATSNEQSKWFYTSHPLITVPGANSWEEKTGRFEQIVIWTAVSGSWDGLLQTRHTPRMSEIRLDLSTQSRLAMIRLIDVTYSVDFPRVHPRYVGKKSDFVYGAILEQDGPLLKGFVKFDTVLLKIDSVIHFEPGVFSSDVVPLSKPDIESVESDDVFLAAFIWDSVKNRSEWILYDGKSMSSQPVIHLRMPQRVPYGFRGEWIAEDTLQRHLKNQ